MKHQWRLFDFCQQNLGAHLQGLAESGCPLLTIGRIWVPPLKIGRIWVPPPMNGEIWEPPQKLLSPSPPPSNIS